ncbi:hypothetical protein OPS25_00310 [Alteromonas ponticola]|uniref:Methanethiol oxidase n=1 Tax=Alteromonas aquimaris TaxID=2998417 RepID=A0ABT3P2G1_9ALTE|nr:hypothetical protein [Alteromonas aquimaris]MCW8106942.1 hypothetical protein [Alteromonas aquimaris]
MNQIKLLTLISCFTFMLGCSKATDVAGTDTSANQPDTEFTAQIGDNEKTQGIVLLSGLPTLNTKDSIAILELDPESAKFGEILYEYELPEFDAPLHHLYYSPNGRLYATGLGTQCSLAEIALIRDATGAPTVSDVECLDTQGQVVGEDIMWHSVNGKEYMFVTFMGGTGLAQPDGGSVGVFNSQDNSVIKVIEARKSEVGENEPYIMFPHGISAYGDRMVVTSTIHPDLATGVGNALTIIDLNKMEPIENIVTEDAQPVGFPSSPVEVLFVRPSIVKNAQPAILVNTMFGFETWKVPYNESDKSFGVPEKLYDGATAGTGVPLELYGNEDELFISHAIPGIVKRYSLNSLPELVSSGEDIQAEPGAHHMIFYSSASGRKLIAIQNNLLNLGDAADNDPTDVDFIAKVNHHSLTVHDLQTGERLGEINFKDKFKKGIDNIEALFGSGFVHHH